MATVEAEAVSLTAPGSGKAHGMGRGTRCALAVVGVLLAAAVVAGVSVAVYLTYPRPLVRAIHGDRIAEHLNMLAALGPRRTEAQYAAAVDAVEAVLRAEAPSLQLSKNCFQHLRFDDSVSPAVVVTPGGSAAAFALVDGTDFVDFRYMPSADVGGPLRDAGTGCTDAEFAAGNAGAGSIALVSNWAGNCTVSEREARALRLNVSGLVFIGAEGADIPYERSYTGWTLPMIGVRHPLGVSLRRIAAVDSELRMSIKSTVTTELIDVCNLIAETVRGLNDSVVMVGAHLDTVNGTIGINDNGSGSAAILELALRTESTQLFEKTVNKIRFAWWAAEEDGLWGSYKYLDSLSTVEKASIAAYINLDMVASPNYVHWIGANDSAPEDVQAGCAVIESELASYFTTTAIPYERKAFRGNSDFWPFLVAGIPAGSIAGGASEVKTVEERSLYGGLANAICDPCYHKPCDDLGNYDEECLEDQTRAVATALESLAKTVGLREKLHRPALNATISVSAGIKMQPGFDKETEFARFLEMRKTANL